MAPLYPSPCYLSSPSDSRARPRTTLLQAAPAGLPRRAGGGGVARVAAHNAVLVPHLQEQHSGQPTGTP